MPIRVASSSPDTFPLLGTQWYPILAAVRQGTLSEHALDLANYRAAYHAAGHPGDGDIYLRIPIPVADTEERAVAEPQLSMMQSFREVAAHLVEFATLSGAPACELTTERVQELASLTYDEARREKVIVGTPELVAQRLREVRDELGLQGILVELNCGKQIPHAQVMRHFR